MRLLTVTCYITVMLFYVSYIRRLRGSTLFPYTTLFRSWGGLVPYGQVWRAGANENTTVEFTDPVTIEGKPLDRKSTRLNSSHANISYAVFCLKKKNIVPNGRDHNRAC